MKNIGRENPSLLYNVVCDTPEGGDFLIDTMPDYLDADPIDNSKPHVHTFYEIIWFRKAGGTHTVDFQQYPVLENSLFLLCPGQVHHFDGRTRHEGILLKFCTDFLKDDQPEEDAFVRCDLFNVFDPSPYCLIPDAKSVGEMLDIVERMRRELDNADAFAHQEMIRSLAKIFLIYVHRHGERRGTLPLSEMNPRHRLFIRFRQMVEQRYTQLHTVSEYARELAVSQKTLSLSVRECSGKTPLALINSRIALEAKRLTVFTNLMTKEIAYRLGFDDPSYFLKLFKRETGFLPSDFRKIGRSNLTDER